MNLIQVFASVLILLNLTTAHVQDNAKGASAQSVLQQARAALGGGAKLSTVKGLSVAYKFRRLAPNGEQRAGDVQLDFLLPDKYVRNETRGLPRNIGQVITFSLLNGDDASFNVRTTTADVPVLRSSPLHAERDRAEMLQRLRKENAMYLLQLLLVPPASFPIEFSYAGEAQAEDGRADAVDARGPGDFRVRLFFDKDSHRLLMMSYTEPPPEEIVMGPPGKDSPAPSDAQSEAAKRPDVQVQLRFSDYRAEGGILVAHLITREKDGKVDQEMDLKSFTINPSFKPDYFSVKAKR